VATAAALALGAVQLMRRPEPPRVMRFDVRMPGVSTGISWPRVSPDGRMLAYLAADSNGTRRVWVRPMDALEAHPLPGVEGTARPFWSPDSRFLAFIDEGKLRKVPVSGGPPVTICDAPGGYDGAWGVMDAILFDGASSDSIRYVPASGGIPKPATTIDRAHGERYHAWPYALPDGRHFLFVAYGASDQTGAIKLGTFGSMDAKVLGQTDGRAEYAPPGYLVFPNGGTLLAQPVDVRAGKTTGDPVPVGEDVAMGQENGDFSVSSVGVMAYRVERAVAQSRLVWMDRNGRALGEAAPPGAYLDIALSPDATRLAVCIAAGQPPHQDIWVRDLVRGVTSRLTFDPTDEIWPVWSPDGNRIAYASSRAGEFRVFTKAANGVGAEDSLGHTPGGNAGPTDWSRDGRTIVVSRLGNQQWDILTQSPGDRKPPTAFLQTPFSERFGRLSPDGHWMAYMSSESGRTEIYVVPTSGPGGKWQVSTAGGIDPLWRADGRELFYRAADKTIMAVPVSAGATFELGTAQALFKAELTLSGFGGWRWWPAPDGKRFLLNTPIGGASDARFVVVTDWSAELRKR
jgi:Tol biopolymer transport system component